VRLPRLALLLGAGLALLSGPAAAQSGSGASGAPPAGLLAPTELPVLSAPAGSGAGAGAATLDGVRGQLRPRRHTILAAGLAGQISEFPVELGSRVEEGGLLVRMVCDEVQAELGVTQARIGAAAARYNVNRRLAEARNISDLEVDLSRAELAVARAERARIQAQADYCEIAAPFQGVVVDKLAQAHQHVAEGEPLLELVDDAELEVEVAVPSTWLPNVGGDARFEILLDETGQTLSGRFVRTVGRIDPVSQTLRVIGRLDDPPPGLLPGMSGDLRLLP
jgi:RND family efflux transporter MFP subunit